MVFKIEQMLFDRSYSSCGTPMVHSSRKTNQMGKNIHGVMARPAFGRTDNATRTPRNHPNNNITRIETKVDNEVDNDNSTGGSVSVLFVDTGCCLGKSSSHGIVLIVMDPTHVAKRCQLKKQARLDLILPCKNNQHKHERFRCVL